MDDLIRELATRPGPGREDVAAVVLAAARAHGDATGDERYALRREVARLERALAAAGRFRLADDAYFARLELLRRDYRARWRDERDIGAWFTAAAYALWRWTSGYGTRPLRLLWVAFNAVFWFGVLYFVVDYLTLRTAGKQAFAAAAVRAPASYLILGFQGLFPGTGATAGNTVAGQLALAAENALGAALLAALIGVMARRLWRGEG